MNNYKNIILNIPHSSNGGLWISGWDDIVSLNNNEVKKWTDWYTDIIFSSKMENVYEVVFKYSRFLVDIERLINDPLEKVGQGIIYRNFNGHTRKINEYEERLCMNLYYDYYKNLRLLLEELTNDDTIIIDCHSFPNEHCPEVDICIGFNEDNTNPSDEIIKLVEQVFNEHGYKTALNHPYSNSITPQADVMYHSMMIEVNKRCYMNEQTLNLNADSYKLTATLNKVYETLMKDK